MRFVSVLLAVIVMAVVSGCGKQPGQYGNFANAQSGGLAGDSVAILKTAYPPAKTRLNLLHQYSGDVFGVELVEALRREGYAIAEYAPPPRGDKYSETHPTASPTPGGLDFGYVIDHLAEDGGMRLSLFVGDETLSRLYAVGGTPEEPAYAPLGDWVWRQEGRYDR